jgi:hypothetical protein
MLLKNFVGWSVANKTVGLIMFLGFIWLDIYLFKKYRFYKANDIKINYIKFTFKPKIKPIYAIIFSLGVIITIILSNVLNNSQIVNKSVEASINIDGITNDKSIKIIDVLKECGLNDVSSIEHDELLDNAHVDGEKGYRVNSDGINIILYINKDDTVNQVRWADKDLYKDGKVVSNISDYVFSIEEQSKIQVKCQDIVSQALKSPSTAKFPNITKWAFSKETEKIIVQSYVDSENSFGATIRSEFQVTFSKDDNNIISFIFNGEEYMK